MKPEPIQIILEELFRVFDRIDSDRWAAFARAIRQARRIFVAGAGRSGLMMRAFAMRLMHLGFPVYVVGDTTTPGIQAGDLLLIGSGSGKTPSLVGYADRAKTQGAKIGLITARSDTALAHTADFALALGAPTPKAPKSDEVSSAQPMGALFEQSLLIALEALVMLLMEETGQTSETMFARHANLE
ncbi:MAG: 6-phospho-3-hexuloisomerase [candidate division Zixibacteria bacterium]|nr:6-phospho-3-hexuloisomerase [candidate division Zixibacteria bacterium]